MLKSDIAIVGAGIAGASLAAEVARAASVLLIEAESHPGYHSTGRSAAFWSETYGGPRIQPLTSASHAFLNSPPPDFHEGSLLRPRGALTIARESDHSLIEAEIRRFADAGVALELLDRAGIERHIARLRPNWNAGLFERGCSDIDVAALHAAYLRKAKREGARLMTDAEVLSLKWADGVWRIETRAGAVEARIVVNAAGAWADAVAVTAGVGPVGIQPNRRTIAQVRVDPPAPETLPLILDARETFYFKPESGGRLWLSPQDETPVEACDVQPEEMDIAVAIDRLQGAVDWQVERVEHSWAGLRSFAPDRLPVYGFDQRVAGFFWFAGQGGFGIQTAPAAAMLGASLLLGVSPAAMVAGIDSEVYSAARFAN